MKINILHYYLCLMNYPIVIDVDLVGSYPALETQVVVMYGMKC